MELKANFQQGVQKLGSTMSMPSIINGEDGITPLLRINDGTNLWEVSYDDGETWESLGVKATGAEISSVEQITTSNEDGGENVVRVTLTDGRTFDFTTKNGKKGDRGIGISETIVVDDTTNRKQTVTLIYTDGTTEKFDIPYAKDGKDGKDGTNGTDGKNGSTPYIQDGFLVHRRRKYQCKSSRR